MSQYVIVSFGDNAEYEIPLSGADTAGLSKDEARKWLHQEFDTLECSPSNPMGKVLVHGEYWDARAVGDPIAMKAEVRVVAVGDRRIDVEPV